MNNLEILLSEYVKKANEAIKFELYAQAHNFLLRACECALLLAKKSMGAQQAKYLDKYRQLQALIQAVENKIASTKGKENAPSINANVSSPVAKQEDKPQTVQPSQTSKSQEIDTRLPYTLPPKEDALPKMGERTNNFGKNQSLSPQTLNDYIGQPQAVVAVKDLIVSAKLRNTALPHLILYGSHGLGKTTFSKIIANEMGVQLTEINVSKINVAELVAILKRMNPRDILFIDEIHTLPVNVAESILYSALQDGRITYMEGKGKTAKTVSCDLPPFTLIGATTEMGKLAKPLAQRTIQIRLEEYTEDVIALIVQKSFSKLGMSIATANALKIAQRCRNNARNANNMVKRIADKALVHYAKKHNLVQTGSLDSVDAIKKLGIVIEENIISEFFVESEIDAYGLESGDRELLRLIIERYDGGPVGVDTLARAMNESKNVIAQRYEAYLIQKGLLKIENAGRIAMPAAYEVLGLSKGENAQSQAISSENKQKDSKDGEINAANLKDKRYVRALNLPDEQKCRKLEKLITYPNNFKRFEGELTTMFTPLEKPMEEENTHYALEIEFENFKRTLICDSRLEEKFAFCLASIGYVKDIMAQSLEIPYISMALANHRYFPDFVIRDYQNRLAVIEMKNFEMASYHLNIDKYERLKRYCEENGYGYAEIMKPYGVDKYVSLEELKAMPVDKELEAFIIDAIQRNGVRGEAFFTNTDLEEYGATHGEVSREAVYAILLNNRALKNTDRSGGNFRIELDE